MNFEVTYNDQDYSIIVSDHNIIYNYDDYEDYEPYINMNIFIDNQDITHLLTSREYDFIFEEVKEKLKNL